jgi:aerobic carbon-monoxide dehydrogenase medium subunit
MKPPPFEYYAPRSLDEALSLLAQHGDEAKPLAGGQSLILIPAMNFRLARPAVLIDLNHVSELFYIRADASNGGGVHIGAMTRLAHIERDPAVAQRVPLLHETMPNIAHPQIRNRSTFGGSLAHADPAAELPAVAVALDATMRLRGPNGEREVGASEFFIALFTTALESGEMLTEIVLPSLPARTGWAFKEVARRHGDYALAGAAAVVTLDDSGLCQSAKLVYLGVGDGPVPANQAAAGLIGQTASPDVFAAAADAARGELSPGGDIHASADFRRHLIGVIGQQVLETAFARASGV